MNKIKYLRTERGWTQERLGKELNVKGAAISKYESESIPLTDESIKNLYIKNTNEDNDISTTLDRMKKQLATSDSLMFDGQPATEEQVQAILNAIEMGEAYAKQRAKEKFTPKKYRK